MKDIADIVAGFKLAEGDLLCHNRARNAFEPVAADSPSPPGSTL